MGDPCAGDKATLQSMFDARNIIQFAEFYPVGHRSTNYKKFFSTNEPYAIRFKSGYEPYVLVSRKHMPWYDERFRGYGWDKVGSLGRDLVLHNQLHVLWAAA